MSETAVATADTQIVVFRLGDQEFGLEIAQVKEIIRLTEITAMPNAPEAICGVINLRGKIVPVVELHRELSLDESRPGPDARIVVVDDSGTYVGLKVDAATGVIRTSRDSLEPASAILSGRNLESVKGVLKLGERLIILLDLQDLLRESANLDLPGG